LAYPIRRGTLLELRPSVEIIAATSAAGTDSEDAPSDSSSPSRRTQSVSQREGN